MNASQSTVRKGGGPRTAAGKNRASRNSRKHCLFSAELNLSPEERREFNRFSANLRRELAPDSALRELRFDDVLTCAWRYKCAVRFEQAMLMREFQTQSGQDHERDSPMRFAYRPTEFELGRRLKFLDRLKDLDTIPQQLEREVTEALGPDFWHTLIDWAPSNLALMHISSAILEKSQLFGMKPSIPPAMPMEERHYQAHEVEIRRQMMRKIIDLKRQQILLELDRIGGKEGGQSIADATNRLDLCLRYSSATRRDLERALRGYLEAKAQAANS